MVKVRRMVLQITSHMPRQRNSFFVCRATSHLSSRDTSSFLLLPGQVRCNLQYMLWQMAGKDVPSIILASASSSRVMWWGWMPRCLSCSGLSRTLLRGDMLPSRAVVGAEMRVGDSATFVRTCCSCFRSHLQTHHCLSGPLDLLFHQMFHRRGNFT